MIRVRRSAPPVCLMASPLREVQLQHIQKRILGSGRHDAGHYPLRSANEIPGFMRELRKLFRDKCAFCEIAVGDAPDEMLLAFFRPTEGALQINGTVNREHYYWLSWEWTNFYLACPTCIHFKGKYFPTLKNPGLPGSFEEELLTEEPLLLDPCRDDPSQHLQFDQSGFVHARQRSERGEVTIRVLHLNRDDLVVARKTKAREIRNSLDTCLLDPIRVSREMVEPLVTACSDDSRFAGMSRQLLWDWLDDLTPETSNFSRFILAQIQPLLTHRSDDSLTLPSARSEGTIDLLRMHLDGVRQGREIPIYRAFLSIDLKGSTAMKIGQSPAAIDYSFTAFRSFVMEILDRHQMFDLTWAGDGGMGLFESAQDAVKAALELLRNIAVFNREQNKLPSAFEPRCGIDWGEVFTDPRRPLPETFSPVADFAGHLQKEASANGLLISEAVLGQISNQDDFRLSLKRVDGKDAWEYVQRVS